MNRNKEDEEKTFSLDDIIQELIDNQEETDLQEDSDLENNGLTRQNISNYLKRIFDSMGLPDAKEVLRVGKTFAFTEQEKDIIKCLIVERNGKLKRHKKGKNKGQIEQPDFEFLFKIMNGIKMMLLKRGYDKDKLYDSVEKYMTNFLENEASISITISRELQKTVKEHIANQNTYLRTYEKFLWMRAMEEELNRVISKWNNIFSKYEELMKIEVCNRIQKMYYEACEIPSDDEITTKTNAQVFEKRVYEYLEKEYDEEWKALYDEKEKLLLERGKKEKHYNDSMEYQAKRSGKNLSARYSLMNDFERKLSELSEIDRKIYQIEMRQNTIYNQCCELAYDELWGKEEKVPVSGLLDTQEMLWKARENQIEEGKDNQIRALQELLIEASARVEELRKNSEIE